MSEFIFRHRVGKHYTGYDRQQRADKGIPKTVENHSPKPYGAAQRIDLQFIKRFAPIIKPPNGR